MPQDQTDPSAGDRIHRIFADIPGAQLPPADIPPPGGQNESPPDTADTAQTRTDAEFVARVMSNRGEAFVSMARMLSLLSGRDVFRIMEMLRRAAKTNLEQVELEMMRHSRFGRESQANQLAQFRTLYARAYDIATMIGGHVRSGAGDEWETVAEFLAEALETVSVLILNPTLYPKVDPVHIWKAVPGAWLTRGAETNPPHAGWGDDLPDDLYVSPQQAAEIPILPGHIGAGGKLSPDAAKALREHSERTAHHGFPPGSALT
jgi:hypothetical protein